MGVASLVLGILALLIGLFGGVFAWIGVIFGIAGIVLGALGRKDPTTKGIATAGLVCSIIGTFFSVIVFIACVACAGALKMLLN